MEAKTALELWNDGVEGRLNLQLYRCDVDSLLQGFQGRATSSLALFESDPARCEELFRGILREGWMTSPGPWFHNWDSSSDEDMSGDVVLEGRMTPPLRLFDHLDSPTYEELFEQNWKSFEHSNQELESSRAHKAVLEGLDSLDSPQVICSVMPEPIRSTRAIQAMVMYPPSIKKMPKKRKKKNHWGPQKKSRPPRKTTIMVSDDENDDEVQFKVENPPGGMIAWKGLQEFLHSAQPVGGSSSVRHKVTQWESTIGTPTTRVFPTPPNAVSEVAPSFAEHFARCAVDWDYPRTFFSIRGYEPESVFQGMAPSQTGLTIARSGPSMIGCVYPVSKHSSSAVPAHPMTALALEEKFMPALGAYNGSPRKKRYADSDLSNYSERLQRLRLYSSQNVGLENVLRQNKQRQLVT